MDLTTDQAEPDEHRLQRRVVSKPPPIAPSGRRDGGQSGSTA